MFITKVLLAEYLKRKSRMPAINIVGAFEGRDSKNQKVNLVLCSDAQNANGIVYHLIYCYYDGGFKSCSAPLSELKTARAAFEDELKKLQ